MKNFPAIAMLAMVLVGNASAALDTTKIDNLTGLKGKMNEKEGVYKVTFPRSDTKVAVGGWTIPPFMGLGTWAAFIETRNGAMVMGDTVLFEDEVNPVISVALDNGLSVTALHNHFFFDHPKVYFMHIEGEETLEQLANAVRKVYDKAKEVRAANPQPREYFRRNWVAGEKCDFSGTAEQNLRHERRNQQRNGEIYDRPSGDDGWHQDRQRDGREHVDGLCRQR